jgi:hypothetical protein
VRGGLCAVVSGHSVGARRCCGDAVKGRRRVRLDKLLIYKGVGGPGRRSLYRPALSPIVPYPQLSKFKNFIPLS